jgi:hypothetical protein
MTKLITSISHTLQLHEKRLGGDRQEEDNAMLGKVLLMVSVLWSNKNILASYTLYIMGFKLNGYGEKLVQKGSKSITRGEQVLKVGKILWEKGQTMRITGLDIMRDVENAREDQQRVMDEAKSMILKSEAMIENSVEIMDEGHDMISAGEEILQHGCDFIDEGERVMKEGEQMMDEE